MTKPARAPLRILEIEPFGRGGLAHYAYNLACSLAERGHEVTLATAAGFELGNQVDRRNTVTIVEVFARAGDRFASSLSGFPYSLLRRAEAFSDAISITKLTRRLRPDIVHLHSTNPVALLYLGFLRTLGTPVVATAHVVTPHETVPLQGAIYRHIHQLADLVIAHSAFDRRRLLTEFSVAADRVTVIPHGEYGFFKQDESLDRATARRGLGLEPGNEVALFFGYIREYKGLDVLLAAWPGVAKARPEARLIVAGDPVRLGSDRRTELADWAARLGVLHHFDYVPFSEVQHYFAAADVVVMPYRHISQSGVLYLALSLGIPVVATRVGALPEILRDGENALLVAPESTTDLARALVKALGDPELRERLSQGGLRLADAHSWSSIAKHTETAFSSLVLSAKTATAN